MLELRSVTKRYSGIPAVQNVSFVARAGEVTGYLGLNGSGKSTTLKMITGLIEPSDGEILFRGQPVDSDPMAFRQLVGYVPEEPHLYPHLTGAEYLEMVGHLRGLPARQLTEKIEGFLRLLSLYQDRYVPISSYSKGMRQKVLLIAALLHNPELVLLDEPFSGLDVNSALVLRDLIRELASRGKVVLFSSHDLEIVERVCSRVVILHKGRIVANDSIEQLRVLMSLPTLETRRLSRWNSGRCTTWAATLCCSRFCWRRPPGHTAATSPRPMPRFSSTKRLPPKSKRSIFATAAHAEANRWRWRRRFLPRPSHWSSSSAICGTRRGSSPSPRASAPRSSPWSP